MADRYAVHYSSRGPEHYTPEWVLEATREVLGGIDVDPCSDPGQHVGATQHFTEEDDGLRQPWRGRVYMNPPYGRKIGKWTAALEVRWRAGMVVEAVALVPARTDTQWFVPLWSRTLCFVRGRLRFLDENYEEQDPAPFPSAVAYYGENAWRFARVFGRYGAVVKPAYEVGPLTRARDESKIVDSE